MNNVEKDQSRVIREREVTIEVLQAYADKNDFHGFFNKLEKSLPKLGTSLAEIDVHLGAGIPTIRRWARGHSLAQKFVWQPIMNVTLEFLRSSSVKNP